MKLKALKQKRHDLKGEGRALLNGATADGDRALTAQEDARFAAIETEIAALDTEIAALERDADRRRAMQAGDDAAYVTGARGPTLVGVDRATLDPTAGFRNLADFAMAVHSASPQAPNRTVDPRLAAMYQGAPTGYMREGGSNDGFMVPPEMRDRIWELVFADDKLISEVDAEPTSANQVNDHIDESTPWGSTGVKAVWRTEAQQMLPTRPSVQPRSIILNELYAFVTASEELLEDAPRLGARLEGKAAEAINWKIDEGVIAGDGVGKLLGFMKSGALVTVAKEAGQPAGTLVAKNVTKMYSRMLGESIARSHWRINSDVIPELEGLTIGDKPVWLPPNGLAGAPGGFLLGRPIRLTEHCQTLGELGDIQFIDPKGYYALRKNGGIKFASSIHLYFDYGLQAFRWTIRLGGQPHLRAPVAPKNGTATKSHFVTLQARA